MPKKHLASDDAARQTALRQFKAEVFSVLAHPTRIHIIECLREGEHSVGELVELIQVEPTNASQHLAVLRSKDLVVSRKEGNLVFYALRDPVLALVLVDMHRLFTNHLQSTIGRLQSISPERNDK